MKGVILAGGTGSRLRPITHTTQKQLVPIANKPVIQHVIEDLRSAGISEIGIVIGGGFPEEIKEFLKGQDKLDVEITYILQGEPLGLAHAVGCAEDFVGDSPFVVYFGDTILSEDITSTLINSFEPDQHNAGLVLQSVEEPSRFGIVDIQDGRISRILEKPDDPPSDLAYVGSIALTPSVFQYIEDQEPSWRGELELTQVLHNMASAEGSIRWDIVDGVWKDVGTPDDVVTTNQIILGQLKSDIQGKIEAGADVTGPISVGEGSTIEASATVHGPAVIGRDTRIQSDTHINPYTSIGQNCIIRNSQIGMSVVMDGAEIRSTRIIKNSVIGEEVIIDGLSEDSAKQYVIGRDSMIKGNQ